MSSPGRAVSLSTAVLLHFLCDGIGASRVLDLGSGFTSVSTRVYGATKPEIALHAVDDSKEWLARTADFLRKQQLRVDGLFEWSTFQERNTLAYDLIIHDLGSMTLREKTLEYVLQLASDRKTIVVLDDMHKPKYRDFVLARLESLSGGSYFGLQQYTTDQFGRFCGLVCDVTL